MGFLRFVLGIVAFLVAVKLLAILLAIVGVVLHLAWIAFVVGLIVLVAWLIYRLIAPRSAAQA